MTRAEFEQVPLRPWDEHTVCRALVILPTRRQHDSGYRCMEFVAVSAKDEPICRIAGGSDVIHIDGIGGYGEWASEVPHSVEPKGWSIDCLKVSGLLRLFSRGDIKIGAALSSLEVYGLIPKD